MFVLLFLIPAILSSQIPAVKLDSTLYPPWAHKHWVWLPNGIETQDKEIAFVQKFLSLGIPVGAVDIDSTWSTGINNFVWNTSKFPNASAMIDWFHSRNIMVIAWATSIVSYNSPNYQEGCNSGYFLEDCALVKWWHPDGSFLDYTNPNALQWWHNQMDPVLAIGIDGWKNDGSDALLFELGGYGWSSYSERFISEREYANLYYRDFFYYTRSKRPNSLCMNRPVDSWEMIYLDFAPRDVVFAGWVGDQDPTFSGMQDALRNMFHSAWNHYLNFGSDTGGYRGGNRTKELFIRWAQMSAFCPLFENGGEDNHSPWLFDKQTVDIYRSLVVAHDELSPYFLTHGYQRYQEGKSMMKPRAQYTIFTPDSWDFLMGPDLFVCPIVESGQTVRTVKFPDNANWVDLWTNVSYAGGSTISYPLTLDRFPVFRRAGSIIPLEVSSPYSRYGDVSSNDALTLLISHPISSESLILHQWQDSGLIANYSMTSQELRITITSHSLPIILLLQDIPSVRSIHNHLESSKIVALQSGSLSSLKKAVSLAFQPHWIVDSNGIFIRFPPILHGVDISILF